RLAPIRWCSRALRTRAPSSTDRYTEFRGIALSESPPDSPLPGGGRRIARPTSPETDESDETGASSLAASRGAPAAPTERTAPSEAAVPAIPTTPEAPSTPTTPAAPTTPTTPATPSKPESPATSGRRARHVEGPVDAPTSTVGGRRRAAVPVRGPAVASPPLP